MTRSKQYPPKGLFVKWCRRCGRSDLQTPLRAEHYSGGRPCGGKILTIEYQRRIIWFSQWADVDERDQQKPRSRR